VTHAEYGEAMNAIQELLKGELTPAEAERLTELAATADAYEREHYPLGVPSLVEVAQFRLDQMRAKP
jgi:antitoxin component HigA of HigAB toxin-antitoxin module